MASIPKIFLFSLSFLPFFFFFLSLAQSCSDHHFQSHITFSSCNDLPSLNCSLHWNYSSSTNGADVAFRCVSVGDTAWIAWAVNPTSRAMIGSQAFVSLRRTDGSLTAYTSPITTYETRLEQGNLAFPVHAVSSATNGSEMTLFVSFQLPGNTTVNHAWQVGPIAGNLPGPHKLSGPNIKSFGTLDFLSGKVTIVSRKSPVDIWRTIHGILNAISWGFLMPIGALVARYMRRFQAVEPLWFQIHRGCQCLAAMIGLASAALGFWLGWVSKVARHSRHRNAGVALVCCVLCQVVVALFLRPKKELKFYRVCWKIFHYLIGYGTIMLSVLNVFWGLESLEYEGKWEFAYFCVIVGIGFVALMLEVFTWKKSLGSIRDNVTGQVV